MAQLNRLEELDIVEMVVVDDDCITLKQLQKLYGNLNLDLYLYSDVDLAISHMVSNRPNLLFVDLFMPKMDGIELLGHKAFEQFPLEQNAYLHSAIPPSEQTLTRTSELGVQIITKDLLLDKNWVIQTAEKIIEQA